MINRKRLNKRTKIHGLSRTPSFHFIENVFMIFYISAQKKWTFGIFYYIYKRVFYIKQLVGNLL